MKLFLKVLKGLGLFKIIVWVLNIKRCWPVEKLEGSEKKRECTIDEKKEGKKIKSFFILFFSLISGWAWVWLIKNPRAEVEGTTISNYYEGDPYFENLEPLEVSFFFLIFGCVLLLEFIRPEMDEDWMTVLWDMLFF